MQISLKQKGSPSVWRAWPDGSDGGSLPRVTSRPNHILGGKSDDDGRAVNETGRFSVSDDYRGCGYIILALLAFVESRQLLRACSSLLRTSRTFSTTFSAIVLHRVTHPLSTNLPTPSVEEKSHCVISWHWVLLNSVLNHSEIR